MKAPSDFTICRPAASGFGSGFRLHMINGARVAKPLDISAKTTVYIVDDDDGMRRALDTLLSTVGYKTAVFSRPSEFLAGFKADIPGCLVLDIRMPEMSGLELQQQLNSVGSMLPVIFITGHGDVPMAVQAMKEGEFEFIKKPFREQDLLDSINHALKQDAESRGSLARRAEVLKRLQSLTPREHQVMDKMCARSIAHLVKLHLTLSKNS
jgi:FixJ family two-component response regulator